MRQFVAMKAFVVFVGKVLILRESSQNPVGTNTAKFDVVGGRIEPGESWDSCLLREIQEETGLTARIGKPFFVGEWRPIVKGEQWQIIGLFLECFANDDKVTLSQDHDHYEWIGPQEFRNYNLIDNLIPAFEAYLRR
ncbi:NUDIX domain-containing protein [Candidatus Woesearchaeota archaeon]|nr:NUDIX domain-containing protein [Candidatus Woesearchaeota archaeon]